MSLYVTEALKQEDLAEALFTRIQSGGAGRSVLEPVQIIVQNAGLGRWLQLYQAKQYGISAGLDLPFARSFIGKGLESAGLYNRWQALEPEAMRWRIFESLLRGDYDQWGSSSHALQLYLPLDHHQRELRCWKLAMQLADLFDQYAIFRSGWLFDWLEGRSSFSDFPHADWQQRLFAQLREDLNESSEGISQRLFGLALDRYCRGEGSDSEDATPLHVFGISTYPPLFLSFFRRQALKRDVFVYHLVCSEAFLGDLPKSYRAAMESAAGKDRSQAVSSLMDNALLIASGQASARFQSLLLSEDFPIGDMPERKEGEAQNDLQALQSSIRYNLPASQSFVADGSISVHLCHSAVREVQILQQQLIALFEAEPDLRPEEILVHAPDISDYADAIEAVFGQAARIGEEGRPVKIPYCIADRLSAEDEQGWLFLDCLFQFLQGRQSFRELSSLLDFDPVCAQLGMDREEMQQLLSILYRVGVRWGIDADAREHAGHPSFDAYTWDYGLQRLLNGLLYPPSGNEDLGVFPLSGRMAELVGALSALLRSVFGFYRTKGTARTFSDWLEDLFGVLQACLGDVDTRDTWFSKLLPALGQVEALAGSVKISFDTFREVALGAQQQPSGPSGLLRRGITFCRMQPVRHIPARVICILGLNENSYPRQTSRREFDLIQQQVFFSQSERKGGPALREREYLGDRRLREEDRQLFLDCVLNARERLYLSYIGQSNLDNKVKPPSILLNELEQFLSLPSDGESEAERQANVHRIMVSHPLQEWSQLNFVHSQPKVNEPPVPLHFETELARIRAHPERPEPFLFSTLEEEIESGAEDSAVTEFEVSRLTQFFKDPADAYLRSQMLVNLNEMDWADVYLDEEPLFDFGPLEKSQLRRRVAHDCLSGLLRTSDLQAYRRSLEADLTLPPGLIGEQIWASEIEPLYQFLSTQYNRSSFAKERIHRTIGTTRLIADLWLDEEGEKTIFLSGALKAKKELDFLSAIQVQAVHLLSSSPTRVVSLKEKKAYRIEGGFEGADGWLDFLMNCYRKGQQQPLPFSPRIAHAYVKAILLDPTLDHDEALNNAYSENWETILQENWSKIGDESRAQRKCFDNDSSAAPGTIWRDAFQANAEGIVTPVLTWLDSALSEVDS